MAALDDSPKVPPKELELRELRDVELRDGFSVHLDDGDAREELDEDVATCRWFILLLALAMSSCVSGVVFGWSALVVLLKREGAYEERCDGDDSGCAAQEVALAQVFTIGVLCMFVVRLPLGLALDRFGARRVVVAALLGCAAGAWLFALEFYALGFALITGLGNGAHIGAMHLGNLFPSRRGTVTTAFNTAHQISALVFTAFLGIANATGASLSEIFRAYALALASFALFSGCCVQPALRFRPGDRAFLTPRIPCLRVAGPAPDDGPREFQFRRDAWTIVRAPCFVPFVLYKSLTLLSLQFFVAVLQAGLAEDGRNSRTAAAMNLTFNVLAASMGILVGLPCVGPTLDKRRDGVRIVQRFATAQQAAYCALLAASQYWGPWPLGCDIPAYALWASGRMTFFAYFFAHVQRAFGDAAFGTAVGLLSLAAGGIAFVVAQPLTAVAFRTSFGEEAVAFALVPAFLLSHAWNERYLPSSDPVPVRDTV